MSNFFIYRKDKKFEGEDIHCFDNIMFVCICKCIIRGGFTLVGGGAGRKVARGLPCLLFLQSFVFLQSL